MSEFKDNAIGTGAGVAAYIGLKKVSKNMFKPVSDKIIKKITNYSAEEKEILKQATKDAFELSGLKNKRVHLHSVNSREEVNKVSELLTRKIEVVLKKNKFWGFLQKIEDKLKSLEKKFSRKPKPAVNPYKAKLSQKVNVQRDKRIIENLRKEFKRVELGTVSNNYGKEIKRFINKSTEHKRIFPEPPVIRIDKKFKKIVQTVARAKNAFYYPITKDIVINEVKFPAASFHEMGHALNATGSKLMKSLAVGRHVTDLIGVPLILAVGLLKPKKKDGEKPKGVVDKITTFIKNNVGKLTFAALIPTLVEEGIASTRGGKLAKKVLNPVLLKKVNKNNFLAWTTYLTGSLILSGITALSVMIRDKVASEPGKNSCQKQLIKNAI